MYYEFFGLKNPPFRITPDTQLFYSGGQRAATLDALEYAVVNGEGITKVVGEVGSGKTMLLRMLATKLANTVQLVYFPNPKIAPENILHALAFEVGLEIDAQSDRLYVMRVLHEYLLKKHSENKPVVILIEEAQSIPLETLEEIRLLSNLETQQHKLLQIVLFGQPELDVHLAAPHVRQIKERITNSFNLKPLEKRDINDYLMFRLGLSGYNGSNVFTPAAIKMLSYFSKGLMRRINILADKAMLAAFSKNTRCVSVSYVWAAAKDSDFGNSIARIRMTMIVLLTLLLLAVTAGTLFIHSKYNMQQPEISSLFQNPSDAVVADAKTSSGSIPNKQSH